MAKKATRSGSARSTKAGGSRASGKAPARKPAARKRSGSATARAGAAKPATQRAGSKAPSSLRWRNAASMYGVHPGVSMVQNWITTLKEKTGRTLDDWVRLIRKEGPKDEKACRAWLKEKHGLGTNSAWWMAERATKPAPERGWDDNPDAYIAQAVQYVEGMYAEPKDGLRPIHMRLVSLVGTLGREARMCPCQTIVPVYRNHVIAQIKPRTRTVIEFGFALGAAKGTGRLRETGGFAKKDRITHAIDISSPDEVDAEVERWLREAFALDGDSGRRSKG